MDILYHFVSGVFVGFVLGGGLAWHYAKGMKKDLAEFRELNRRRDMLADHHDD